MGQEACWEYSAVLLRYLATLSLSEKFNTLFFHKVDFLGYYTSGLTGTVQDFSPREKMVLLASMENMTNTTYFRRS